MAQPCKVYGYTNVETEKDALANIASAAQAGGWTIDKNAALADGELYLHSAGNGGQRLFFSLKLENAYDDESRHLLSVHGNTGFDASAAWDAQPGRFTSKLACGYTSYKSGKPVWLKNKGTSTLTNTGWWVVPPVAEQIVLVCPTFVLTAIRVVATLSNGEDTPYSGWVPLLFGAADGAEGETELNMVLWSAWSANCAFGLMLSALYVLHDGYYSTDFTYSASNYGNIGVLWKGRNVEGLPKEGTYGYKNGEYAPVVVRTGIVRRPVVGRMPTYYSVGGTVVGRGTKIEYTHKGSVCPSVPGYDAALQLNPGTLRHMLIKPLLYVCENKETRIAGELPYWAVNLSGLKPKDRIRIGNRVFMVLPDISDTDEIGLAVEVEA